ncbi:hypothetical protein J4408_04230 [Candidatus Pacearchaeota archaeon]|nr:hypothetical protein [Candidatus Pacearchaeota archaeon]
MTDKNTNLGYKGDWCEQTAELARTCGDEITTKRNYWRAIEAYEIGGLTEQALRVAIIIGDNKKIKELEGKLK